MKRIICFAACLSSYVSGVDNSFAQQPRYSLIGSDSASATLDQGFDYYNIASYNTSSEQAIYPAVTGAVANSKQAMLFLHEASSVNLQWRRLELPSLWDYESGGDPLSFSFVSELTQGLDGSLLALGSSTSIRAGAGADEGTVWKLNPGAISTIPVAAGVMIDNPVTTTVLGGDDVSGYCGTDSIRPISGQLGSMIPLPLSPASSGGSALDCELNKIVGNDSFHAAFWTKQPDGSFVLSSPELPLNTTSDGQISEIADSFMGGYLFSTSANDFVPVIWNTDGSIHKVFDSLPGYGVTEMVVDQGVVVTLFNKGTVGFDLSGPSYIYATGWDAPKALYGEILPASPDGESTIAVDIAPGGSLWVLAQTTNASGVSYSVYRLESSVGPTSGSWYNSALPADVNNDGLVNSLDALEIGDQLRSTGERTLGSAPLGNALFIDTNNDAKVSVADLQVVIDKIFLQNGKRPISSVFYTSLFSSFNSSATTTDILRRKAAASLTLLLVLSAGTNSRTESAKLKSTTMLIAALDLSKDLTNVFSSLGSSSGSLRVPIMIFGTKTSKLISQSKSVVAKAKVGKKL